MSGERACLASSLAESSLIPCAFSTLPMVDPMVGRCCWAPASPARRQDAMLCLPSQGPTTFLAHLGCSCTGVMLTSCGWAGGHAVIWGSCRS